jgi:hypothetical protein
MRTLLRLSRIPLACLVLAAACSDGTGGEPDDVPPTVDIISPPEGFVTTAATVTVNGRANDDRGVTRVTYARVIGEETTLPITRGRSVGFSFTMTLAPGRNDVVITASDASGNQSLNSLTVTRE